ncbi:hypothetical protein HYDPIDRAFT_173507 [Hydnomerulius pinastri MD-312]|nr:hypothetical protein HYDPIDRAFT_173507 [Hydnomerulius pinastri MD-312]
MPSSAGYEALPQTVEEDEVDVGEQDNAAKPARGRTLRRSHKPGHIDLSKLDNAFKRWTESIAQKVKRKKKVEDHSRKEIWQSVFDPYVPPYGINDGALSVVKTLDHKPAMTQATFDNITQSVRNAISAGIHPKMITKGSSGSYFARAKVDGRVQTVAVFKPKDEEPYGRLNPKTTKWIHRQFRWIIPFGRACLIPNLSYISEAAASLLDERLTLNIVPRTQLVSLSSSAFFYDWLDRNAAKKGKPLPEKIGSMQFFMHGYTDASDFLRKHPWPGRSITDTFDDSTHRKGLPTKKLLSALKIICGRTGDEDAEEDDPEEERALFDATEDSDSGRPFYWSRALQQSFREELEKYYLMLNTDRGADNYMIKYCEGDHEKSLIDVARQPSARPQMPLMSELRRSDPSASSQSTVTFAHVIPPSQAHASSSTLPNDYTRHPHIHIAAIDNSLSFPHEHPQGWRSYTYGWLYLPVSVIGRPFSEKTRQHFLPLLTSKVWWEETTFQLRKLFAVDPDFHPKMFRRQLAVIKGQAYNIIESLKHEVRPLELTRRTKALVWDDEIEVMEETPRPPGMGPLSASPRPSISTMPLPRRTRSHSHSSEFPPSARRRSSEANRPVPFSAKFQKVHPGTTGVIVLEHLERLDAVEASLQRLGVEEPLIEEEDEEEVDVGESSAPSAQSESLLIHTDESSAPPRDMSASVQFTPPGSPGGLTFVPEDQSLAGSVTEEDLAAMSKSMSHAETPFMPHHTRWNSHAGRSRQQVDRSLDWMNVDEAEQRKRTVVVERLEMIDAKPLLSCW